MPVFSLIHITEQFFIIFILLVPLDCFVISEVIAQWNHEYITLEKFGLFPILVQ